MSTLGVGGTLTASERAVSKQCSFNDQIHWFLVGGAGRFVYKMYAVSQISIHTRVDVALVCGVLSDIKALHVTYEY